MLQGLSYLRHQKTSCFLLCFKCSVKFGIILQRIVTLKKGHSILDLKQIFIGYKDVIQTYGVVGVVML